MYVRKEKDVNAGGGVGFAGLLTIAFVVLKLCHVIDWSWWWVLSPIWISLSIAVLILVGVFACAIIFDRKPKKK